jgi:tetratricopeptide (TPR) repeat protein
LEEMSHARDLLTLSIAKSPAFAQGWAWLGRSCLFLDKFGDGSPLNGNLAQASLDRALTLLPDLTDAHAFLTLYEVDSGRASEAIGRLSKQLTNRAKQPELYAALVHALRFKGLLAESLAADKCAKELDPAVSTSVAHTLFLTGDFAGCIEAYTGRTSYYLDAAAWAALGLLDRAESILKQRLSTMPLSPLIRTLLESLLFTIAGQTKKALQAIESATLRREPEIMIYFARHLSYLNNGEMAVQALETAANSGFICASETLRNDPWLGSVRRHSKYKSLLNMTLSEVREARKRFQIASKAYISVAS